MGTAFSQRWSPQFRSAGRPDPESGAGRPRYPFSKQALSLLRLFVAIFISSFCPNLFFKGSRKGTERDGKTNTSSGWTAYSKTSWLPREGTQDFLGNTYVL
jgi:hypothetical protein